MKLDFAARTDKGQQRPENQDSVLALAIAGGDRYVFAVADGVGGLAAGAAASQAAVGALEGAFTAIGATDGSVGLAESVLSANRAVLAAADGESTSGSTMVALLLRPGTFEVAHVGDSRGYLLRNGEIHRLTQDHSLVAEQVRAGILTEEAAAESRNRNVITRSLGIEEELEVDAREPEALAAGDVFLLSSDGLHGVVSHAELQAALWGGNAAAEVADALVSLANERGGPDNISAVVVRVIEA